MKICAAQIQPIKGEIDKNIERHTQFIRLASSKGADMIVFPELSLTGYEPELARSLATTPEDPRLDDFQRMSDNHHIIVGVGIPTRYQADIRISLIIFQPHTPRQTYSKQILHTDELPYFVSGDQHIILTAEKTIAPAICYESLQPDHAEQAFQRGAEIYVASVAKSSGGVARAAAHYPTIAKKHSMIVLMANCVGPCDDFESAGQSALWNQDGFLVSQLSATAEGILLYDTDLRTAQPLQTPDFSATA